MSATNDGLVPRYTLPGVSNPVLPEDIANKAYVQYEYFRLATWIPQSIIPVYL